MKKLLLILSIIFSVSAHAQLTKTIVLDRNTVDTPRVRFGDIYMGITGTTKALKTSERGVANGVASLDGSGKVPIAQLPASLFIYKGTWNPSTNSPALADGTGTNGFVYMCSTGGTRNLGSGSVTYASGDFLIHNGSTWQKSAGTAYVNSVNGLQGIVTLTTSNVAEGSNLYYTDARARAAHSAGTGISYNSSTGVITSSITQYTDALARSAMNSNSITMNSLSIAGTGGAGFVELVSQASTPSSPSSGIRAYAPSAGGFGWINSSGYTRTFSNPSATRNLSYTLPPAPGILAVIDTTNTFTGAQIFSANGAINTPSINLTGTPYAGTTANSYPLLFLNNTGANPTTTTWSTSGTYFGIMGANGFGGNYIDIHPYNSSTQTFRLDANGNLTINGNHYAAGRLSVGTTGTSNAAIGSYLTSLSLSSAFSTSGFGIRQDACTYNSSASANSSGAHVAVNSFATPTLTATNSQATATSASTIYIAGAPVASTNMATATNLYALYVNSGTSYFGGAIQIGNTVNSVSPTSPNRTITMVIGGTTYYIPCKTTND